jgi:hypothetical protein
MAYSVRLAIFIVLVLLLGAAFFALFFYEPIKNSIWRHNPTKMFAKKLYRVALDGDYFLLNDLLLPVGSQDFVRINHVLGGNKYLYVISDCYYEGALVPNATDTAWTYYTKKDKKQQIPNPLLANKAAVEKLAIAGGIDPSLLVGLVVVNDDCFLAPFENVQGSSQLVSLARLEKTIGAYEGQDVVSLNQEQLFQIVNDLHELSAKNHRQEDEPTHE